MPTTRQLRQNVVGADQHLSEQDRPISDDGKVRRFAGLGIDETDAARAKGARGRHNVVWLEKERQQTQEQIKAGSAEVWSTTKYPTSIHREHQSTTDGLKRTNADLQHLIESTEIGIIVVASAMRIRHATPAGNTAGCWAATSKSKARWARGPRFGSGCRDCVNTADARIVEVSRRRIRPAWQPCR